MDHFSESGVIAESKEPRTCRADIAPSPPDGRASRSPDRASPAASAPRRTSLTRRTFLRRRLRPRENTATLLRGARAAALALAALAALALGVPEQAAAQTATTFVSNFNQLSDSHIFRSGDTAQPFTTGSNTAGYTLSSVDVKSENRRRFSLSVCATDSNSYPDTTSCTPLVAPGNFAIATLSFMAPTGTTLDPDTTYTLLFSRISSSNPGQWSATTSDNQDTDSLAGWEIANEYHFLDVFSNVWFVTFSRASIQIDVKGTAAGGTTNTAPVFSSSNVARSVAENTAAGQDVGAAVTATDADAGDSLNYTLGGTDAAAFDIVESSGQIRTKTNVSYDFEAKSSYTVTVTASDGTATADASVTISVTDVAEPPSAPATPAVSAVSGSTTSLSVSWAAPANAGPAITDYDYRYRVKSPPGLWTEVTDTPIPGLSATITELVEGTEYEVQVRATNADGTGDWSDPPGSGSTASNAAPSFTSSATFDAAENQTAVGRVAATDGDPGDSVTGYAIRGGADASKFSIVPATGVLTFVSAPNFEAAADADTNNDYVVVVRATSGADEREKTADQTITVTVTDVDEPLMPAAAIGIASASASEGDAITFTVTLAAAATQEVTVDYATSVAAGDTAAQTDFTAGSGTLTFMVGETRQTFTVSTLEDSIGESDETFTVTLDNVSPAGAATLPADPTATGMIIDDDGAMALSISVSPGTIAEAGGTSTVTVSTGTAFTDDQAITLALSGTATETDDYTIGSKSLTLTAGTTSVTATVTAEQDVIDDDAETVIIAVVHGGATVATGTVTITDDDAAPALSISVSPGTIAEAGGTSSTVTVSTGAGSTFTDDQAITLALSGTATETEDYIISSKSLTLPAGVGSGASSVTATVTAVDDNFYDGRDDDETIVIAGSRAGTAFGAQYTILLVDDEKEPEFTLILTPASISENGGKSIVTGTLDTPIAEALTVTLEAFPDPDADPPVVVDDYVISGSLTFTAHSAQSTGTLTVTAADNRVDTDNKLLYLEGIPDLAYTKASGEVELIIEDDDAAPVLVLSVNPASIGEAGETSTVTVSTGAGSTFPDDQTITLVVSGTATEAEDYTISSKSLTLSAGVGSVASSVTATVTAVDDDFFGGAANKQLSIAGSRGGADFGATRTITIIENEEAPKLTLTLTDDSISENGGSTTVTASVAPRIADAFTVTFGIDPTAPATAADYDLSGTLSFAALSDSPTGTVTIAANDNRVDRSDKTVSVTGRSSRSYFRATEAVTLTIEDEDAPPVPVLEVSTSSIAENGGTSIVTVTTGTGSTYATDQAIMLSLSGTATVASDYSVDSTLTLPAGMGSAASSVTTTVTGVDDRIDDDDETVVINALRDGTGFGSPQAVAIADDDAAPVLVFSALPASIAENGGVSTVTVGTGTGSTYATAQTITLAVAGTAIEGSDYTIGSRTLRLPAGVGSIASSVTTPVTGLDDGLFEGEADQTVLVTATHDGTDAGTPQTVAVVDDEANSKVVLTLTPDTIEEARAAGQPECEQRDRHGDRVSAGRAPVRGATRR